MDKAKNYLLNHLRNTKIDSGMSFLTFADAEDACIIAYEEGYKDTINLAKNIPNDQELGSVIRGKYIKSKKC